MKKVGEIAAPLQVAKGGPILMVQVENEYGSFGDDHEYTGAILKMLRDAGFDGTLYTADGSDAKMLAGGPLPGIPAVINFGAGDDPEKEFANFAKFRTGVPKMVGEFWTGWFDHWGEKHHTTDPATEAKNLDWLLSRGIGVNLYMVHGGTSWGPMAGANFADRYQPDISSYDYDAPIDEAGRLTPKFYALRDVIKKYLPAGETLPEPPEALPLVDIPKLELKESAPLVQLIGLPLHSDTPVYMESLGQTSGLILYRHPMKKLLRGKLEVNEARDYALVSQRGNLLGVLDRRRGETALNLTINSGSPLEILVDTGGHVNFGPRLVDDRKGIVGSVKMNGEELKGWDTFPLPARQSLEAEVQSQTCHGTGLLSCGIRFDPGRRYVPRSARMGQGLCLGERPQPGPFLGRGTATVALLPRSLAEGDGQRDHRARPGQRRRADLAGTQGSGVADPWQLMPGRTSRELALRDSWI